MAGFETVVQALGDSVVRGWSGRIMAPCPSHEDDRPSLSVSEGEDGRALLYDHAGCATKDVAAALGLSLSDLFTGSREGTFIADRYVYVSEDGSPLIRVVRTEPKGFFQERMEDGEWKPGLRDTRRVLYNLPAVLKASTQGDTVYVVEGEKDSDNLSREGVTATTCIGGAGKWRDEYTACLRGANVIVVADADEVGRRHAAAVAEHTGGTVVVTKWGKDATEHLLQGFGVQDFIPLPSLDDTFEQWDPWDMEPGEQEWLLKPYVPCASRVLLHGASGSLKTLWSMWLAVRLAYDGHKVAFMSTEMNKGQAAKRFQRFSKPPAGTLKVFGSFMLGQNLGTAIKNFEGYSLIIVDSWSSTQGDNPSNDNDTVARLDTEFFQPLVQSTGATVLVIDNTGHNSVGPDGVIKRTTARGASRKRDIQEVELHFSRPDPQNNFRCSIEVTKMRLDEPIPPKIVVETPRDRIEFMYCEQGMMSERHLWPGLDPSPEEQDSIDLIKAILGGTDG